MKTPGHDTCSLSTSFQKSGCQNLVFVFKETKQNYFQKSSEVIKTELFWQIIILPLRKKIYEPQFNF